MEKKKLLRSLHMYMVLFTIGYKNYTAYIYDILGINITFVLRLIVIIFFYKAIYTVSGSASIDGYTIEELIRSLIFVQAVVISKPRITDEIGSDIKSGKIAVFLLNPISYIGYKFFEHMPRFLYNLGITLLIGIALGYVFIGSIHTTISGMLGGIILLLGGTLVAFFGYMMVGLLGFYTEDTEAYRLLYSKLDLVLGGNILPIVFMPLILQTIAFLSPFAYSGYTAGLLFVKFDIHKFWTYFGMQALWIMILLGLCAIIYAHGKKKVTINGG